MISIPTAVANDYFKWQLDLFWYNHKLVYGRDASSKAFAIVINKDNVNDQVIKSLNWSIDIPYQLCNSFYDELNITHELGILKPINIQIGLAQIIEAFDDNETIEIIDCDQFHLKCYDEVAVNTDELFVSTVYEDWHLKSLSDYRYVIEPYFLNNGQYYNGGFEPIIGKVKTFKKILKDWITIHRQIVDTNTGLVQWWAGMYSLSAACERNKVQMISKDMCYIPNLNQPIDEHHCCHYSVDPIFNKRTFPDIDISKFPNNIFYNRTKEWLTKYQS